MIRISGAIILVSIELFAITWFRYTIQNDLIHNINRETMGMEGFKWRSSNTYIDLFGLSLILMGFKLFKPVKT
jgi:hypothetical protein